MRVALVSTPFIAVPPPSYGGTELIVAELAHALRARGIEVVVYATGDSRLEGIEVRSYFAHSQWPPALETDRMHAAWALRDIARDGEFDLVHSHANAAVELARHCAVPMVHTIHHDCDADLSRSYAQAPRVYKIGISHSQAAREPTGADFVIHHGLSPERFVVRGDGGYFLFIGRYSRVKGPHLAIDVARRAGVPIVLAGRAHAEPGDDDYFERELKPRLALPGVTDAGPVGGSEKQELIAAARAVLFPISWEEPFGLVMIEAMLSGVPVLALRRGSVPEVIDQGVSGAVCATEEELARAALGVDAFDRALVRARALQRFTASRMAREHVAVYRRVLGDARSEREAKGAQVGA